MMKKRGNVSRAGSPTTVRWNRLLAACAFLSSLSMVGRAGIIDPQMGVDNSNDSTAFTAGITLGPDSSGGGYTDYFNNTGFLITSITFTTNEVTQTQFDDTSFSCNQASDPTVPNPFFLFCLVNYVSGTGLEFIFHGTLPGPGGPDLGIPPGGNFAITFNDNYSLTVDSGGWGSLGDPTFTATNVQIDPASSPEPRSALLVGVTLIAGVSLLSLRRRLKTG